MPLKTHLDEQPTLNLTPMIDIVFLLIIFFMVGTKFAEMERDIDLKVPTVKDSGALTDAPRRKTVHVYRDGTILFDRRDVTLKQLAGELRRAREEYPKMGILIRGDGRGSFQRVAEVLNACRQADVTDLGIAVEPHGAIRR